MKNHIIEIAAGLFLLVAIIWAVYYIKKNKNSYNHYIMEFIPNMFPTLGMLGTFGGITYGLWFFNSNNLEESIPNLLQGLTTAFFISIAGVVLLLIFSFITNYYRYKNEKDLKSDETLALIELITINKESNELLVSKLDLLNQSINLNNDNSVKLNKESNKLLVSKLDVLNQSINLYNDNSVKFLSEIKESVIDSNFIQYDNQKVHIGNILISIYEEGKQQTNALQNFSTDLANKIELGFTQIKEDTSITDTITNSFDKLINDTKVTEKLDSVRTEITGLGTKLQSPAEDVVKGLSDSLAVSMKEILHQVKGSIGEGINSDMVSVAKELKAVSTNLNGFPDKINEMTSGLGVTFKKLENGLAETSTQTNEKSKEAIESIALQMEALKDTLTTLSENITNTTKNSTESIRNQFDKISQTVASQAGNQEQSIIKTAELIEKLNENINKLNAISQNFGQTVGTISEANNTLVATSSVFKDITKEIQGSSSNLSEAQKAYGQYIGQNQNLLNEYVNTLNTSRDFNKDLVTKYEKINDSFGEVFSSVDSGINSYSNTMKTSLDGFLNSYSSALNKGTDALNNSISAFGDSIENLADIIPKK